MKPKLGICVAAVLALTGCGSSGSNGGMSGTGQAASGTTGTAGGSSGATASGATGTSAISGAAGGSGSGGTSGAAGSSGGSLDAGVDASVGTHLDAGSGADAGRPVDGAAAPEAGAAACGGSVLGGGPLTTSATKLNIGVHDPSMIWDGTRYYLFATGGTLGVRSSADILTWTNAGNVLPSVPAWVTTALGSTPASLWAPDISYFNGQFHVYYAGSTFGSNDSVIGLSTTPSLKTPAWTDQGLVVQSITSDDFNAIDPNVSFDQNCTPWLAFGSFWSGIKMRKLDPTTGKPATDDTTLYSLASRNGGAIEAASIISHNGFYYLFVSYDLCCQGVNSTYKTEYGRAPSITGPYMTQEGGAMLQGNADLLLMTETTYIGPGGGTAWKDGSNYIYVYHYYDGADNGNSKLQVRPIVFGSTDWITLGDPLFP